MVMRRLNRRHCLYLCTTFIFVFLLVYLFLYSDLTRRRPSVENEILPQMDPEFVGVGLPKITPKPKVKDKQRPERLKNGEVVQNI